MKAVILLFRLREPRLQNSAILLQVIFCLGGGKSVYPLLKQREQQTYTRIFVELLGAAICESLPEWLKVSQLFR